jgi:Domain of unknown function DUF29
MPETARELYEADFYAWTRHQARELRRLKELRLNAELDLDHVAEEIEDLGNSVRKSVRSEVRRILEHFLKLAVSPADAPRGGWRRSIVDARTELSDDLTAMLYGDLADQLPRLYAQARKAAAIDLENEGEADAARLLPVANPWTLDDVLRDDWYPDPVAPPPPP